MHKFNMSFVFSFLYSWNRRLGSEQALQLNGWNLRALQNETHVRTSILNTASSVGSWAPPHSTSRAWRVPEWACVLPYSFDGWRCSEGSGDIRRHPDFKGSIYATTLLVGSSYSAFQLFCPPPPSSRVLLSQHFGQSLVSAPHYFVLSPIKCRGPRPN